MCRSLYTSNPATLLLKDGKLKSSSGVRLEIIMLITI